MSKIINGGKVKKHTVKPYNFKEITESKEVEIKNSQHEREENIIQQQPSKNNEEQNKIIENLLLKIEELSNKITNIQSEFQKQIEDCNKKAQIQINEAFEKLIKYVYKYG